MKAWTVVLLALSLTCGTAAAQERVTLKTVDQRLKRVEKVMDQSLLELLQEIDALKREIRKLRGELEAQAYELDRSQKRNRDLYLDTDQRIKTIETDRENALFPPAEDGSEPADDTSGSLGNLPVFVEAGEDAADSDTAIDELAPEGQAQAPPIADEQTTYQQAYDLLASRQFDAATSAFTNFLNAYPDGSLADNAWYWRGESLYAQQAYLEAIEDFETLISAFPRSGKVPDARLKIGFAQYEMEQYKSARNTLSAVLQEYSGRGVSELAKKRLQKMNSDGQ